MKLYPHTFITAVLLSMLAVPVFSSQAAKVSVTTLPNGMKVIVREGHAVNLVAVEVWVRAGSVNEAEQNNGISHFVEHMIFKSTAKYGPGEIDREIEGLGAELNGGTSRDWVHFYTTAASECLPTVLEILADAIMNAQFRPEDVEKERQVILDEIARAESSPSHRALDLFSQTAFAVHPYRLPPAGARDSINRLARDDLVAYYNRYYVPANTCVVIAGDVVMSDALALVRSAFSGFDRVGEPIPIPPVEPPPVTRRVQRFQLPVRQAYVVLGYHVSPASEFEELCALDVILALFGDTHRGRISSVLNANGIRFDKVETEFLAQRHPALFCVLVSADAEDAAEVAPVLLTEFRKLTASAVANEELAQAKRLVEGGDLFEQETFSGQARALGLYDSIASHDFALKYGAAVRDISARDVAAVAAKYFGMDNYCLVTVEPESAEE